MPSCNAHALQGGQQSIFEWASTTLCRLQLALLRTDSRAVLQLAQHLHSYEHRGEQHTKLLVTLDLDGELGGRGAPRRLSVRMQGLPELGKERKTYTISDSRRRRVGEGSQNLLFGVQS